MSFVPDFVIVGAPKCGTTSLHAYLSTHPSIAMASLKEPFFWCPDIVSRERVTEAAAYEALWDDTAPGALKGEASADYILSEVAIPSLVRAREDIRLIAILRNPADMAAAFHAEMVQSFQEPVKDFETAWRLQDRRRRKGWRAPGDTVEPKKLQYARVCALGDQLERLIGETRAENRLVINFDRLARNPRSVYLRMLRFLGLSDDGRTAFPRTNPGRILVSPRLAAIHRSLPHRMGRLYAPARALATRMRISPSAIINRFNIRERPRRPIDPSFEEELLETFRPQVEKIELLLRVDLSHWKRRDVVSVATRAGSSPVRSAEQGF